MVDPESVVTALRDLIEVVRTVELERVDAPVLDAIRDDLVAAADQLRPHLVEGLRTQASLRPPEGPPRVDGADIGRFFPYSPVSGALNPLAPPLRLWRDGEVVRGEATLGTAYNGPPDGVHGGMVAALLDELLGATCVALGRGGFTGTLSIRYHALTPLDRLLELEGRITGEERSKVFVSGELRVGPTLCATAEGIFVRSGFDAGWT